MKPIIPPVKFMEKPNRSTKSRNTKTPLPESKPPTKTNSVNPVKQTMKTRKPQTKKHHHGAAAVTAGVTGADWRALGKLKDFKIDGIVGSKDITKFLTFTSLQKSVHGSYILLERKVNRARP